MTNSGILNKSVYAGPSGIERIGIMDIINTEFDEIKILMTKQSADKRGLRKTIFSQNIFNDYGINFSVVEERIYAPKKNAFYGIHFQNSPLGQNKLISLINGEGIDYIIDLRKSSKTYKKWIKIELVAEKNQIIYIPHGFGHGFLSISDNVIMSFKYDRYFDGKYSRSIHYNDPEINLNIQIDENLISDQDKYAPFLKDSDCNL
jgi:dTDP-4-dehydrorhamnose 3,5-epimerase